MLMARRRSAAPSYTTISDQPPTTAWDPHHGVPLLTVSPPKVKLPLPVTRLVTSAKAPKKLNAVPLLKVRANVREAVTVLPFSVTVVSAVLPEAPDRKAHV